MTDDPDDARRLLLKKLKFRAWRRGFREADLILGPFADLNGADLPADELKALEALLEVPDQDLYAWIIGTRPADPTFDTPVLAKIRAFAPTARLHRELGG